MPNNVDAIAQYLVSIGATGGDLLTSDEEEPGFLVSPWITYTLGDDEQPDGNFLLRLRYAPDSGVFQIQFWGRDFGEEWIGTTKHVFVSLLGNRINNKLNVGSLWLDLDEGTVALVSSLIVPEGGIATDAIKANVDALISVLEQYYPALRAYIESSGDQDDYARALAAIG